MRSNYFVYFSCPTKCGHPSDNQRCDLLPCGGFSGCCAEATAGLVRASTVTGEPSSRLPPDGQEPELYL